MSVIKTTNLTKYYGRVLGIENLNMSVEEGEIYGFIGPNGAGKSTTIRTLLSLIYPTSGSAEVLGHDIIKGKREILRQTGYLPSEVFYYDNMRARDLLNYSATFYKKDCSARITELANRLNLDLKKKIEDMSYGNKKKVGIIQGLLHSPKLIVLDEPTGGLDPLMQQTFFDIIREENDKGVTVLFSSHILSEVQKMCDRVAIIKDGSIIKVEDMSEMRRSSFKKVIMTFVDPVQAQAFEIAGAANLNRHGDDVDFVYKGDTNVLSAAVAACNLTNLQIEEPDLEEVFMHYYGRGE